MEKLKKKIDVNSYSFYIWQIDNQLLDAYHQTVLSCVPTPAYLVKKKGPKPCIEFGMIRRVVPENNVDTFR